MSSCDTSRGEGGTNRRRDELVERYFFDTEDYVR